MENDFELMQKQVRETIEKVKNDPNLKPFANENDIQANCRNSLAENIKTQEDADLFRYMLNYASQKKNENK